MTVDGFLQHENRQSLSSPIPNVVYLNVYDLDKYTSKINGWTTKFIGTGLFHVGIECYGIEWSFGQTHDDSTGISSDIPRFHDYHVYRLSIHMGQCVMSKSELVLFLETEKKNWLGKDYKLLSNNCITFAEHLLLKLKLPSIPKWIHMAPKSANYIQSTFENFVSSISDISKETANWVNDTLLGEGEAEKKIRQHAVKLSPRRPIGMKDSFGPGKNAGAFQKKHLSSFIHPIDRSLSDDNAHSPGASPKVKRGYFERIPCGKLQPIIHTRTPLKNPSDDLTGSITPGASASESSSPSRLLSTITCTSPKFLRSEVTAFMAASEEGVSCCDEGAVIGPELLSPFFQKNIFLASSKSTSLGSSIISPLDDSFFDEARLSHCLKKYSATESLHLPQGDCSSELSSPQR